MALNRGFEYREQIDRRGAGVAVLDYLTQRYRHSSQDTWARRLEGGEILLDGRRPEPDTTLKAGQWLIWQRPSWDEPEVPLAYGVLYEDEELLAVAKPRGLPTTPAGGFLEHTLLTQVRNRTPGASPIHRLGRGTSGIVLFARTTRAGAVLSAALRRREMTKIYRALACGHPVAESFSIDIPIGPVPHPRLGTLHAASAAGKQALSRVRMLERRSESSLLEVRIETGRPHQIRIHLATIGHPLVGDPLYAGGGGLQECGAALPGDCGYWLHAERLCLKHPATGSPLDLFCCPPPELRVRGEIGESADSCARRSE